MFCGPGQLFDTKGTAILAIYGFQTLDSIRQCKIIRSTKRRHDSSQLFPKVPTGTPLQKSVRITRQGLHGERMVSSVRQMSSFLLFCLFHGSVSVVGILLGGPFSGCPLCCFLLHKSISVEDQHANQYSKGNQDT